MMNQKVTLQQMIPPLFALLLVSAIVFLALNLSNLPAIRVAPDLADSQNNSAQAEAFDYERAADISAMRWQEMARYYEEHGLLTRDDFDYAQAADVMAFRWLAMGQAYEKAGLLNDRMDSGDVMAYRWLAMGKWYERLGLLNEK